MGSPVLRQAVRNTLNRATLEANQQKIRDMAYATIPHDTRAVGAVAKADSDEVRAVREAEGEEEVG